MLLASSSGMSRATGRHLRSARLDDVQSIHDRVYDSHKASETPRICGFVCRTGFKEKLDEGLAAGLDRRETGRNRAAFDRRAERGCRRA